MNRPLLLCALLLAIVSTARAQIDIAKNGKAMCVIVRQKGATDAESHAAAELADILGQMTGGKFVITDHMPSGSMSAIIVGPGPIAEEEFPDVHLDRYASDETVQRSSGRNLLLAGGRPRGTLYAVFRLLNNLGVRWWAPWATDVPSVPTLRITRQQNLHDKPAFEYREPYWFPAINGEWAMHNTANGQTLRLTPEEGGSVKYHQFVHTFYSLVPPAPYFQQHPEWFSLVNGKRTASNAQLCLTNPQLRDFVVEQVKAILRAEPDVNIVSVSQNDCFGFCECPNCKAVDDAEGSHAGTMIDFVNYVADKIKPEFPNVAIDTLAYQFSRHAPKTIHPRPNVIVRLCSIECNFAAPLDDKTNKAFFDDLTAWSKLTNRLYIWDYSTNFAHYVQPQPNWLMLGPDIQLFAENGVKGVFSEGAYQSNGSEMSEMRAWVLAKLMWNPKADSSGLIDQFLDGYYGAAAPFIRQYLDSMTAAARGVYMTCYQSPDSPYLAFGPMNSAESLWRQAEIAVANDPDKLWRVRQGHLPLQYVWIARWSALQRQAIQANVPWPLPASRKAYADVWLATATGPGPAGWTPMTQMSEGGQTPQSWISGLGPDPAPPGPPPARTANSAPPTDIANATGGTDVQDDRATLAGEGDWSDRRADPAASDGVAVWMPCSHHEWAFQVHASELPKAAQSGRWIVYASIRVEPKSGAGLPDNAPAPFTAGIWDGDTARGIATIQPLLPAAIAADGKYHSYRIGTVDMTPGDYIWVAPAVDPKYAAVWVDRVYLVPEPVGK